MNTIKLLVKKFVTKAGKEFFSISKKGQYLPLSAVEPDKYYSIRLCGEAKMPTKEGIYEASYDKNGLWLDTRTNFVGKNIVRLKAVRIVFQEPLPVFDKDIRAPKDIDKEVK